MSRASMLIVVGVLAILAPFSGLPVAIRTLLAVVLGCVVIGIGVAERSREQRRLVALQGAAVSAQEPEPIPVAYTRVATQPEPMPAPAAPAAIPVQPEVAIMMDIAPSVEPAPAAKPTPVRKPRARKTAAPKTMSPI